MSDDKKTKKGNEEYVTGYKTSRYGDPLTRAADMFFGYSNSDTTHGKGFQQGREDRHNYGSRTADETTTSDDNQMNEGNLSASSDEYAKGGERSEDLSLGFLFISVPFFSIIAGFFSLLFSYQLLGPGISYLVSGAVAVFMMREIRERDILFFILAGANLFLIIKIMSLIASLYAPIFDLV